MRKIILSAFVGAMGLLSLQGAMAQSADTDLAGLDAEAGANAEAAPAEPAAAPRTLAK